MKWLVFVLMLAQACRRDASMELGSLTPTVKEVPKTVTVTRRARSPDTRSMLMQEQSGENCSLSCTRDGKDVWSGASCPGAKDDFVFMSDDCHSMIVLARSPLATKAWAETQVIFIYRDGKLTKSYPAGPMLSRDEVEMRDNQFNWLKGDPRYLQNGVGISFVVRNGRLTRLPFEEGTSVSEETYMNTRETPRDPPRPHRQPDTYAEQEQYEPSRSAQPTQRAAVTQTTKTTTRYVMRVCSRSGGCVDMPANAPPTIKPGANGMQVCRNQSEACGTGADCCSGTCTGSKCQ